MSDKSNFINLASMAPGEKAVITGYKDCAKKYRRKLLSFGLTEGVSISLRKIAPFGDPVEISLRGFSLSLRKAEAEALELRREQ